VARGGAQQRTAAGRPPHAAARGSTHTARWLRMPRTAAAYGQSAARWLRAAARCCVLSRAAAAAACGSRAASVAACVLPRGGTLFVTPWLNFGWIQFLPILVVLKILENFRRLGNLEFLDKVVILLELITTLIKLI
jgi:hypothetical protein